MNRTPMSASDAQRAVAEPFDTTEVRWFALGTLDPVHVEWFNESGRADLEIRQDSYVVDTSHDCGRKQRDNGPFEIKTRTGSTGVIPLWGGLRGRIEQWSKIVSVKPPDGSLDRWSDVDKVVLTRTYQLQANDATEVDKRDLTVPGCDIELAAVSVEGLEAWTFALETWGPNHEQRSLLDRAALQFLSDSGLPRGFASHLTADMGYPEWLTSVVWSR